MIRRQTEAATQGALRAASGKTEALMTLDEVDLRAAGESDLIARA